ncbi:hypothetical protein D8674_033947 [Pyrus ussuriensis x Pyrus communis]|uniref:Uncharacterized protein n=1 Tax=Pyrus ussuriensis x Pyrus communis TaxID=2448454 RepID=A0A5N5HSL6_9ROSA|nr:hypothetical protein D8674_033947 [Pyrus ussuriensis x Pyrus communis]
MSQLITRHRSVTNAPPALSTSTTPSVSAPLIGEPTPLTEATPTASQVNFHLKDISPEVFAYLEETFANRYRNWKSDLHVHFKKWGDLETARLHGCPSELVDWLCKHFMDPKFVAAIVEKGNAVLQEATSQLPPETPIEDVTIPEDVGFQILTEDPRHADGYDCTGLSNVRSSNPDAST